MGKKNKKKQRKFLKAQFSQAKPILTASQTEEAAVEALEEKKIAHTEDTLEVRVEIKKILITIFVLFLVVFAVYLINIKTDIILNTGQLLIKYLNINLQ